MNAGHRWRGIRTAIALATLLSCAHAGPEPRLVDLSAVEPSIAIDMRYAGSENFVGAPIDGYSAPRCLLTPPAARALASVQRDLEKRGLGLLVFDCFRPQRAVDHFVRWAADLSDTRTRALHYPSIPKSRLFELGYIAERSGHSRGSTVDLTLVERGGEPLDMGTAFDFFDPLAATDSAVTPAQQHNRHLLLDAMDRRGFENFPKEWWHYTLRGEPHPDEYFDLEIR